MSLSARNHLTKFSRMICIPLSGPSTTSRALFSSRTPSQNVASAPKRGQRHTSAAVKAVAREDQLEEQTPRLPRSVQTLYLRALRREAEYGVPSCDLQLRSYSVRNLEFFADFALRAAYYLKLPAFGPVPLPRITERWTVPKSNFIFKKAQENFERKTLRRLIQIRDGHPETIELWLAFLRKHAYHGIGMKANVWEYNELGVGKSMGVAEVDLANVVELFGRKRTGKTPEQVVELMNQAKFQLAAGGNASLIRP